MTGTFVSPLFIGGEILLGLSLTVFVSAWIATLSQRMRTGRR